MRRIDERIEDLIKHYPELMKEFSIETIEDFKRVLGDRYSHESRDELVSKLSANKQVLVKEFYLKKCPAGMDRSPACIKVTIHWSHTSAWIPRDIDYMENVSAEFDRIKSRVKYICKTNQGTECIIQSTLDSAFEKDFFSIADAAQWKTVKAEEGSYLLDTDPVSIVCEFGMGATSCGLKGNHPGYHPYDKLYKMSMNLLEQLKKQLMNC